MPWIQLSLLTDPEHFEQIEDALMGAGALSVTASDDADQPILEPGLGETPLWDQVRITGLFEADTDIDSVAAHIRQQTGLDKLPGLQQEQLADQEWTRSWMEHFEPMSFGSRLWVVPEGFEPPDPQAVNLRLDPGLAFGTGTHPTTDMCLRWLDTAELDNKDILDYGCGSGILAIAGLLLGARQAWGVDNDPQALTASSDNALKNDVQTKLQCYLPDQLLAVEADVTLANILAGPLMSLAPVLAQHTRPAGHIVLSGILKEQAEETRNCYQQWFDMDEPVYIEEWTRLHGIRRA